MFVRRPLCKSFIGPVFAVILVIGCVEINLVPHSLENVLDKGVKINNTIGTQQVT